MQTVTIATLLTPTTRQVGKALLFYFFDKQLGQSIKKYQEKGAHPMCIGSVHQKPNKEKPIGNNKKQS